MNAGILPMLLVGTAVGLVLTLVRSWQIALAGAAAFAFSAVLTSATAYPEEADSFVHLGVWISVIATAALILVPKDLPVAVPLAVVINAGGWLGALCSLAGAPENLLFAVPLTFFFVPGRWFRYRGYEIALKVLSSWLIAVAALATLVSLVPTPGYQPDHME